MTDKIEIKGKTVNEAVSEALLRLGARRNEVKVKVLEEPKTGFLGFIGGRQAHVLVEKKTDDRGGNRRRNDNRNQAQDGHDLSGGNERRGRGSRGGSRRRGARPDSEEQAAGGQGDRQQSEGRRSGRGGGRGGSRSGGRNDGRNDGDRRDDARKDQGRNAPAAEVAAGDAPRRGNDDAQQDGGSRRGRGSRGRGSRGGRNRRSRRDEVRESREARNESQNAPQNEAQNESRNEMRNESRNEARNEARNETRNARERDDRPVNPENGVQEPPREREGRSRRDETRQGRQDTAPAAAPESAPAPAPAPAARAAERPRPAAGDEADGGRSAAAAGIDHVIVQGLKCDSYAKPVRGIAEEALSETLVSLTSGMLIRAGFACRCEVHEDEYRQVRVVTDDSSAGMLIGRHGSTVDAVEHIVERMASTAHGDRVRMNLDINNYRRRREDTLVDRVADAIDRVVETGREYHMEPMNARERRLVHLQVAETPGLATTTVADGGTKHVVIMTEEAAAATGQPAADQDAFADHSANEDFADEIRREEQPDA